MNSANLSVAEAAPKRSRKSKSSAKRGRPRGRTSSPANGGQVTSAAAGTLTRTKALLLAALKVWELKHRIND